MILRPMIPADLMRLMDICTEHAAHEDQPLPACGQHARWAEALFGDHRRLFGWALLPAEGGPLRGYMMATIGFCSWSARPVVQLDRLYLRPDLRRRGWGRSMMAVLVAFARANGCEEIRWQAPPRSEVAMGFFRSFGGNQQACTRFALPAMEEAMA